MSSQNFWVWETTDYHHHIHAVTVLRFAVILQTDCICGGKWKAYWATFFYVLRLFITRFPLLMRRSRRINHYPANQGNGNGWWEVGFRITGCHPWWAEIGINGSKLECMDESWVALNSKMNGFWTLEVKKPIIRQAVSLSVLGVVDKYRLYQNPISINCGFPTTCHSTTIGHFPLNLFVTLIAHRYCRH